MKQEELPTPEDKKEAVRQSYIREANRIESLKHNRKNDKAPICPFCRNRTAVVRRRYDLEWSGYSCLDCDIDILTVYEKDGFGLLVKYTPPRQEFETDTTGAY